MGAHSSLHITRSHAKKLYLDKVLKLEKMGFSDKFLERWLDDVLDKHHYNCSIVSDDYEDNDDHTISDYYFEDSDDFS